MAKNTISQSKLLDAALSGSGEVEEKLTGPEKHEGSAADISNKTPTNIEAFRLPSAPSSISYYHKGKLHNLSAPEGIVVVDLDNPAHKGLHQHMLDMLEVGNCTKHMAELPKERRQVAPGSLYSQDGVTI